MYTPQQTADILLYSDRKSPHVINHAVLKLWSLCSDYLGFIVMYVVEIT